MFDNIIVGILILICVVAAIWGWWMENGPEKKDHKEKPLEESRIREAHGQNESIPEENQKNLNI